jgi:hypothetical protein
MLCLGRNRLLQMPRSLVKRASSLRRSARPEYIIILLMARIALGNTDGYINWKQDNEGS